MLAERARVPPPGHRAGWASAAAAPSARAAEAAIDPALGPGGWLGGRYRYRFPCKSNALYLQIPAKLTLGGKEKGLSWLVVVSMCFDAYAYPANINADFPTAAAVRIVPVMIDDDGIRSLLFDNHWAIASTIVFMDHRSVVMIRNNDGFIRERGETAHAVAIAAVTNRFFI